jgi:hypothetical protein
MRARESDRRTEGGSPNFYALSEMTQICEWTSPNWNRCAKDSRIEGREISHFYRKRTDKLTCSPIPVKHWFAGRYLDGTRVEVSGQGKVACLISRVAFGFEGGGNFDAFLDVS